MSLQLAAQHLASKGRGPDTMLVHMAPGEVKSLQSLARAHGGTLTTNPDTGLPEAGFLSSILPMVAGVALGPAGFGLTAMQAGLAAGALGTMMTGSLQKGLLAGLGAYGGAGIGDVVGKAGTAAIAADPTVALPPVVDVGTMATAAPSSVVGTGVAPGVAGVVPSSSAAPLSPEVQNLLGRYPAPAPITPQPVPPLSSEVQNLLGRYPAPAAPTPGTITGADFAGQAESLGQDMAASTRLASATPTERFTRGIGAIADKPELLFNKENMRYGLAAAAPLAAAAMEPPKAPVYQGSGPNPYAYSYDPGTQTYAPLPSSSAERQYFDPRFTRMAEGGVAYAEGGSTALDRIFDRFLSQFPGEEGAVTAAPSYQYTYDPATQGYSQIAPTQVQAQESAYGRGVPGMFNLIMERTQARARNDGVEPVHAASGGQMYAKGGISHLGDYSDGGRLLRGPGDGVSDSIPATIANKRPARLADGEFVVPARIVSELGNGSTEAGARKLYAMMDRIQKRRAKTVGKGKVAVNSRADKLLPA